MIILSPYLTVDMARGILSNAPDSSVYTVFDAELFASRASHLSSLKQLTNVLTISSWRWNNSVGDQIFQDSKLRRKIQSRPLAQQINMLMVRPHTAAAQSQQLARLSN